MWIILMLVLVSVDSQFTNVTGISEYIISNPCTDKNHLFLAPGVLTAGSNNRACLSRFHPQGTARMLLTLLTEDKQSNTASRELPAGDGGCLDIFVPQLPNTKADLVVNVRYPDAKCTWERRITVRISSGRVVVVHTERARYRPGDTLRLRVFALKADLAPAHGTIDEIWVEGPRGAWEGSRVTQWSHVRTRLGLAQLQYDIDELAPPGKWTVRASLGDGSQGTAAFWVGDYDLPPFQLSVRHAPRVLRTSDRLVWTVCVRYPWTEAVEGMLVIRLRGAGGVSSGTGAGAGAGAGSVGGSAGVRTAVRLRAPRACHRHAAAARRVGLAGAHPPDVVVADFSFQEEGTRIWQNTTVVSQVVDKPITLEFLTKHRAVISPGLPYKLKVKALKWDDKPAPAVKVRVCRHSATALSLSEPQRVTVVTASHDRVTRDVTCAEGLSDATGVARVMFTAGDDASPFYRFEAQVSNDSTTTSAPLTLPVNVGARGHAALGPLRSDARVARTFVPLYLTMQNVTSAVTVHFVVITRGGIIYRWGATTQCPTATSSDQIQTAPRNSKCDIQSLTRDQYMVWPDENVANRDLNTANRDLNTANRDLNIANRDLNMASASDALLDRYLLRVMLPIKVTHQMCPDSHLIAYFYHDGELVSASKHFEMDDCFVNKAEATWVSRQVLPGSTASLQVSTPGPALCALTALDTAAKWAQPGATVKELLVGGLKKMLDAHKNLTEYDAGGECFFSEDTPELPTNSLELTSMRLAAAGVRITGGDVITRRCVTSPPATLMGDDQTVPRSDFSEAWLWRLVPVGMNGSVTARARAPDSITRFEAAVVCVSKNGIAVSAPALLQVFREFFIHADSPSRLRRGDTIIVRYRIFNYLYEPLNVKIQISHNAYLIVSESSAERVCVSGRSSVSRRVEVRARGAGGPAGVGARLVLRATSDGTCGNGTTTGARVSDEVVIPITVDPEGVPVQEHKSILLCGKDSSESSRSEVFWSWPPVQAVPGTESLTVWAVGDVTGPLLADADGLVLLPRGCGEQNMARLATNLLALSRLHPATPAATTAREHVARGFTRQLQYIHPSGGFSAFGPSDATSSTWLTAFALRYMRRAHKVLWPKLPIPAAIERAERWLLNQQMENGCFRNEGQVFHRELRGGLNEEGEIASVALTAYVITSLIESSSPLPSRILKNTLSCLRALPPFKSNSQVYAHALLTFAFMRIKTYERDLVKLNDAMMLRDGVGLKRDEEMLEALELMKMARRNEDYVWWEAGSLSTSIEATGYALLALQLCPPELGVREAEGALRWLQAHRGPGGGFVATQDTLVALEALIAWSSINPSSLTSLNVTARSGGNTKSVMLQPHVKIPDVLRMNVGDKLTVAVEGTGCAVIQATRSYNTLSTNNVSDKQLSVQVSVHTDGPFDCDANGTVCFCAAVIEACVLWSGGVGGGGSGGGSGFPAMSLLQVALPAGFGADARRLYSHLNQPNSLIRRIELTPSGSTATVYLGVSGAGPGAEGGAAPGAGTAHRCVSVHAVGPRARVTHGYVRLIDYYTPTLNDTQFFTIPEDCPPRISHESNDYLPSDNLYSKARSLSDSGEIVITHEFSFEDIPEGIPLEDPLYDNLTVREKEPSEISEALYYNQTETDSGVRKEKDDVIASLKENTNVEENNEILKEQNDTISSANENVSKENEIDNLSKSVENDAKEKLTDKNDEIRSMKLSTDISNIANQTLKLEETKILPSTEEPKSGEYATDIKEDGIIVENPKLTNFHVIDTEKDLEVPQGVEGPVPVVVLPPQNFVIPPYNDLRRLQTSPNHYYFPITNDYRRFNTASSSDILYF